MRWANGVQWVLCIDQRIGIPAAVVSLVTRATKKSTRDIVDKKPEQARAQETDLALTPSNPATHGTVQGHCVHPQPQHGMGMYTPSWALDEWDRLNDITITCSTDSSSAEALEWHDCIMSPHVIGEPGTCSTRITSHVTACPCTADLSSCSCAALTGDVCPFQVPG